MGKLSDEWRISCEGDARPVHGIFIVRTGHHTIDLFSFSQTDCQFEVFEYGLPPDRRCLSNDYLPRVNIFCIQNLENGRVILNLIYPLESMDGKGFSLPL